jgi:hypothetical protein
LTRLTAYIFSPLEFNELDKPGAHEEERNIMVDAAAP